MKKEKRTDWKIIVSAMACITVLECVALIKGINGTFFMITLALLAGLAGYVIPSPIKLK